MMKLTLILNGNTQNLEFDQDILSIGRADENTITIKNKKVSRKHAKIERIGEGFQITDLASGNGTRLNGKKIDFSPLGKDDVIKIGDAVLTVEDIDDEPEKVSLDDDDETEQTDVEEGEPEKVELDDAEPVKIKLDDEEPVKISLDDDDEQDLLPNEPGVHDAPTERNLTPLEPGLHTKETEMEIDVLPEKPEPKPKPKIQPKAKFQPRPKKK